MKIEKLRKLVFCSVFITVFFACNNINAFAAKEYKSLPKYTVKKQKVYKNGNATNSNEVCLTNEIKVNGVGNVTKITQDNDRPITYNASDNSTKCKEKWQVDFSKLTNQYLEQNAVTVGSKKYAVRNCYCEKYELDKTSESCVDYYKDSVTDKCHSDINELLNTRFDQQTSFGTTGRMITNLPILYSVAPIGVAVKELNIPDACAGAYSFDTTPSSDLCLIKEVNENSYVYQKCSDIDKLFNEKIDSATEAFVKFTDEESLNTDPAKAKSSNVPSRYYTENPDGSTTFTFNLGKTLLSEMKTLYPNYQKGSAIPGIIAHVYVDVPDVTDSDGNVIKAGNGNQCSAHFFVSEKVGEYNCTEYQSLQFDANGELSFTWKGEAKIIVHIQFTAESPCYLPNGQTTATKSREVVFESVVRDIVANDLKNSGVCKLIKDYQTQYKKDDFIASLGDLVPECSEDLLSKEEYDIFNKSQAELEEMIKLIVDTYLNSKKEEETKVDPNNCTFNPEKNKSSEAIATYTGLMLPEGVQLIDAYWGAICTEDLYIDYDTPKVVDAAGMGFNYEARLNMKRKCKVVQLRKARVKAKCKFDAECWGADHKGTKSAGPDEEFDQCVNKCDNGKYTQKCINKCYKEVYENEDTNSNKVSMSSTNEFYNKLLSLNETSKESNVSQVAVKTTCGKLKTCGKTPSGALISGCFHNSPQAYGTGVTPYHFESKEEAQKAEKWRQACKNDNEYQYPRGYVYKTGEKKPVIAERYINIDPTTDEYYKLANDSHWWCFSEENKALCYRYDWYDLYKVVTSHGVEIDYLDACKGGYPDTAHEWIEGVGYKDYGITHEPVLCYEVLKSKSNCAINPIEEYYSDLAEAKRQYEEINNYLDSDKGEKDLESNYKMSIDEQYGYNKTTGKYKKATTIYTNDGTEYKINVEIDPESIVKSSNPIVEINGRKRYLGFGGPYDGYYEKSHKTYLYNYDETKDQDVVRYEYYLERTIKVDPGIAYTRIGGGSYSSDEYNNGEYKLSKTTTSVLYNVSHVGLERDPNVKVSDGPVLKYFTSLSTKLDVDRPYTWIYGRVALDNDLYNEYITNYKNEQKLVYNIFNKSDIKYIDTETNEEIELPKYTPNITIDVEGLGTFKQWTTGTDEIKELNPYLVKCMYGVKPIDDGPDCEDPNDPTCCDPRIKDCPGDNEDPSCSEPPCPNPDGPTPSLIGGNNIIFRPINLGNVFPGDKTQENSGDNNGRNPRYNWTGTIDSEGNTSGAALNSYGPVQSYTDVKDDESFYEHETVDPELLTRNIQKLGENIYSTDLEYEFVLTPKNIQEIRKYNRNVKDLNHDGEAGTYIDYDWDLTTCKSYNGKTSCMSNFLNSYVTFTGGNRSSYYGCNNGSTSGGCDPLPLDGTSN